MKQAIRSFLTILLLLCAVTTLNAAVYTGWCGRNVRYSLDTSTGVLSIEGTGRMYDYVPAEPAPWNSSWKPYSSYDIKTVTISEGITSIGYYAFDGCSRLTSINIPNSVTSIEGYAFDGCSGLKSITIPNSVTSIGKDAFWGCKGLTNITIPNNVTSIESFVFSACSGLTSITIPNSVTSIGNDTFSWCSELTSITIPNSVTSIGSSAFYGCSGLKDITTLGSEPPTIESNTFYMYTANLHVKKGCATAYKANSIWGKFNIVEDAIDTEDDPVVKEICATPVISYSNGKISCISETEGAVCHFSYKYTGEGEGENNVNTICQIIITAYATAEGYADSQTVTKSFDLTGGSASDNCDVNGDGVVNMEDANIVVNKYLGK